MHRRRFLAASGRAVAGACGLGPLLTGCGPRTDPSALVFRTWAYEPDLFAASVARFRESVPQVKVDYAPVSGNYHDKMVAQFVARTPLDLVTVRDHHLAEWVEAGWLRPVDRLPGAQSYQREIFPSNWEAMTHGGKLYGLPYYTDFTTWVWNRRMLDAAGITRCGRTLDQITEQCIRIREKRVAGPRGAIEYPLVLGFKQAPLGFSDLWALFHASEAQLFTSEHEPIFPDDPGRRCERVLQWVVDGIHKHRIIDLDASFSTPLVRDLFAAGRQAMVAISKYDLQRLNDPEKSPVVAGQSAMAAMPSLEEGQKGTLGWTRMYCIPYTCRHLHQSWVLMQFMGGRDRRGRYSTPRFWYLQRGLGSAYPALLDDPEVVAATEQWGEIEKIREQARHARPREAIKTPWYAELDTFFQAEVQEVLQARRSPRDGLARIAAECRRLRAAWA